MALIRLLRGHWYKGPHYTRSHHKLHLRDRAFFFFPVWKVRVLTKQFSFQWEIQVSDRKDWCQETAPSRVPPPGTVSELVSTTAPRCHVFSGTWTVSLRPCLLPPPLTFRCRSERPLPWATWASLRDPCTSSGAPAAWTSHVRAPSMSHFCLSLQTASQEDRSHAGPMLPGTCVSQDKAWHIAGTQINICEWIH